MMTFWKRKKYSLGITLSGGGAKGFVHLGVLKCLSEKGIHPGIISGTSAGSIAGAFYAAGHTPEEILHFFKDKGLRKFLNMSVPKGGVFKSTALEDFIDKNIKVKTFEELKIPLKVVATNITNGNYKVFESGELVPAIVASCSIPIFFAPKYINGMYYVDGSLVKDFPVSIIKEDCDKVLGVNLTPKTIFAYKESIKYIIERCYHYTTIHNTLADRDMCDYLIESQAMSKYSMLDLDCMDDLFDLGYKLAVKFLKDNNSFLKDNSPRISKLPIF